MVWQFFYILDVILRSHVGILFYFYLLGMLPLVPTGSPTLAHF